MRGKARIVDSLITVFTHLKESFETEELLENSSRLILCNVFVLSIIWVYQKVFTLLAFAGTLVADDASFTVITRPAVLLEVGHQLCRIHPVDQQM